MISDFATKKCTNDRLLPSIHYYPKVRILVYHCHIRIAMAMYRCHMRIHFTILIRNTIRLVMYHYPIRIGMAMYHCHNGIVIQYYPNS
jgi:hypothetical protein